jgi:hypothetical protein
MAIKKNIAGVLLPIFAKHYFYLLPYHLKKLSRKIGKKQLKTFKNVFFF